MAFWGVLSMVLRFVLYHVLLLLKSDDSLMKSAKLQ